MSSNMQGSAVTPPPPLAPVAVASVEIPEPPPPPSSKPASKRPPPLPPAAFLVPLSDDSPSVEQLFFREGIDGRAESVPPSGRYPFPLSGNGPVAGSEARAAAGSTIAPTSVDEEWLDLDEDVEDPVRTRRRRAARIATAWGTIAAIAVVGVALFVGPRHGVRSAAAASTPVAADIAAHPLAAAPALVAPPDQGHAPTTDVAGPPSPVAASAPATVAASASPRAALHASAPAVPVVRPAATPRAAKARATRARHAQAVRSAPAAKPAAHPTTSH